MEFQKYNVKEKKKEKKERGKKKKNKVVKIIKKIPIEQKDCGIRWPVFGSELCH